MSPEEATKSPRLPAPPTGKLFTVKQANQALVLVRRIVGDIVDHYAKLFDLRAQRHAATSTGPARPWAQRLQEDIAAASDELNRLHGELSGVGCVLKDWSVGLVDFPAVYQGRKVWLCWRLGEPAVTHWHELEAGFAGRQPVGPDFA